MADYYPLIARAVAGLDPNATGESRRALYERARTALIAQLRGVQPPLTEAEITRERLALEEAVRKVEAEAAHRMRGENHRPEGSRGPRPEGPGREAPRRGDILRDSARAAAGARAAQPGPHGGPHGTRPTVSRGDTPPPYEDRDRPPPRPPGPPREGRDILPGGHLPPGPGRPSHPGVGTRGFRDVVADTDELGRAASQATRSARKTFAKVASPTPEFERTEPDMEERGAYPAYAEDESFDDLSPQEPVGAKGRRDALAGDKVRSGFPLKGVLIAGLALILIGGGILVFQKYGTSLKAMFGSAQQSAKQTGNNNTGVQPKITDRVGQPDAGQQVAPIAQRAILYEEDPSDPQGKQTVGTVVWRLDQVAPSPKQKPDTAIKADVELPDRKVKVALTIMRNTDPTMPATSHTMEIVFVVGPDFGTTIANVPGVYAKSPDQPRGTPLAATSVKVQDGYFLIGLSNVDVDRARNIQVLKERSSLDIPIVYGNGKRAILSIEKGSPGDRAFNEAFSAWGQ